MSLYIPGLAAPKDGCKSCMFDVYGQCLIKANLDKPWELTHSCPLIEVPPHGRLGDLDALTDTIERVVWYHQNEEKDMVRGANSAIHQAWYKEQDVYAAIEGAMTIIPAEEG